jgi:hypothetical protein
MKYRTYQFINQDSVPGTLSSYRLKTAEPPFYSRHGAEISVLSKVSRLPPGPPSALHKMEFLSPGGGVVKQLGRGSHPYSVDFKNAWSWNSTPPYAFMECICTTLLGNEISHILCCC